MNSYFSRRIRFRKTGSREKSRITFRVEKPIGTFRIGNQAPARKIRSPGSSTGSPMEK